MDTKENLLQRIEERLTVYANWISQGGGVRSGASEDLYCELLNTALGYELRNMNWVEDNFPAIDLGDDEERLAVQVTSTGTADKVRTTLKRFYDHRLEQRYDRLIVLIAGKADCKPGKFDHPGVELEIWGTAELLKVFRRLPLRKLREVDEFLTERVDAPRMHRPMLHLPVPERRNPVGFLGRGKELAWIEGELKAGTRPVVVAGLGGVGKTELAVYFAKKHWKGQVYFAAFQESFTRTLADSVGQAIPVEERKGMDEARTAALALGYLRRCEPGDLLVLDNAEVTGKTWAELTRDPFYEQLRRLPMAILVTTRHRDTGGMWLGSLERDELRQIFRGHGVNIPEADMDALIDTVGEHTMTVDMIARTIRESWGDVSAQDILTAMQNSTLDDGDFEEIENDHDPEQRQIYAHLRALFDLSGIPEDGSQALRCATLLPQGGMDAKLFRDALTGGAAKEIKKLEKRGWVDLKEDNMVAIHPVVRLVCRTELDPTRETCHAFVEGVWGWYDKKKYDHARFRQMAELLEGASDALGDPDGWYDHQAGYLWSQVGEFQHALKCNLRVVKQLEQSRPDSNNLAAAYNNVGSYYGDLGDNQKALEYLLKALVIREKILPPDHPDIATTCNNVGHIHCELGEHEKALEYLLKALTIREKVLPPDHPDIATACNNMGHTFGVLGAYNKALEYQLRALSIREKVLLPEHPDLATSYNNVGHIHCELGEHEKALEYLLKALTIREKVLPPDHPDIALSYANVGHTYAELGSHKKALECQLKALSIREKVLPPEHPGLAQSYNNLSYAYGKLGDPEKSLEYDLKALAIREKVLPPDHPDLAQSYNNVGYTYGELGRHKKALEYQLKALSIWEKILQPEHPDLAGVCNNLAWTCFEVGRYEMALVYMCRAVDIAEHSLPEGHPHRVAFRNALEWMERKARQRSEEE